MFLNPSCGLVDECSDGTHNCDGNATCYDTPTSFICHCNTNYNGTGEQGQCHREYLVSLQPPLSVNVRQTTRELENRDNVFVSHCVHK